MNVTFVDTSSNRHEDIKSKLKPANLAKEEVSDARATNAPINLETPEKHIPATFDGRWSSDEEDDTKTFDAAFSRNDSSDSSIDSEDLPLIKLKTEAHKTSEPTVDHKKSNSKKPKRKTLTGKNACKYCDTLFASKIEHSKHVNCKYLQCDPGNYVCRICKKELSKKTFSNHVQVHHKNTTCQYCEMSFASPHGMRRHVKQQHKNRKHIGKSGMVGEALLKASIIFYRKTRKIFECGKKFYHSKHRI